MQPWGQEPCLKDIQGDVNVLVYPAQTFDEPRLLREDGVKLDKVGATANVYLFCINTFTVPAVELVRIATVEDFFITRKDSQSHAGGGLKQSKKALEIKLAAWERIGAYTYITW